jgi:hypothetical protein
MVDPAQFKRKVGWAIIPIQEPNRRIVFFLRPVRPTRDPKKCGHRGEVLNLLCTLTPPDGTTNRHTTKLSVNLPRTTPTTDHIFAKRLAENEYITWTEPYHISLPEVWSRIAFQHLPPDVTEVAIPQVSVLIAFCALYLCRCDLSLFFFIQWLRNIIG